MNFIRLECPMCDGVLLLPASAIPYSSAHTGDLFEITCPHCSSDFPVGYVSELRKMERQAEPPEIESPSNNDQDSDHSSSGDGYSAGRSPDPSSSNAQRSNSMNPNNPASKASGDNLSNQLNPNSQAYRSSRRG